jgi:adenosine kinase
VKIAVSASIATDHLMRFPGRFRDSLIDGALDHITLSFLVDELEVRRGGVGGNIAFGMGVLGGHPVLVGAAGADFADYRSWLERHGVDCSGVLISELRHTARFICTTDNDQNQLASFYTGAMAEAREIELEPVAKRVGGLDLVLVGPNDPEAMLRHTEECRFRGIPFAADPSQQLARMDGDEIRLLVDGAQFLFTNEYEASLIEQKTGWSADDILDRVQVRITTLGAKGSRIESRHFAPVHVPVPREEQIIDPTGVGDAFRAGFLCGYSWGLTLERCAQIGSLLATYAIETVGPQEYEVSQRRFLNRLAGAYGETAAAEVAAHVRSSRP